MFVRIYTLHFILQTPKENRAVIEGALVELGDDLKIVPCPPEPEALQVQIKTQDPTRIFDICSEFGRITSVKVDEGCSE